MMAVLLVLGLAALIIFLERVLFLHRAQIRSKEFLEGIKNILAKRRLVEALTLCEETPGPVAPIVKAALLHAGDSAEALRFQVQEAALVELPVLERRLGVLAAIAQVAPLTGLLGTILGFVTMFLAFEKGEYVTGSALAHGMWQALLSTAGGLMLAIPAHIAYHFLSGRVRVLVRDMEWSGNEIMKFLLGEYRAGKGDAEAPAAPRPAPDSVPAAP